MDQPVSSNLLARGWRQLKWVIEYWTRGSLERFHHHTAFHELGVYDAGRARQLRFGDTVQTSVWREDYSTSLIEYPRLLRLPWLYREPRTVLAIGLGGGSFVTQALADFPHLQVTAVEIDPQVIEVAERYFAVDSSHPRLEIVCADGRDYLEQAPGHWDLVVVDAFFAKAMPLRLASVEFWQQVAAHAPLACCNFIGALKGPNARKLWTEYHTMKQHFRRVDIYPQRFASGDRFQNIILVAHQQTSPQRQVMQERLREYRWKASFARTLERVSGWRYEGTIPQRSPLPLFQDPRPGEDPLLHLVDGW